LANNRKNKAEEKGPGAPLWMITYGDMMSLLLCFFVLLFSFSTLDLVKFRSVIVELQGALGVLSGGPMVLNLGDIPAKQITDNPTASARQMEQIQEQIEEKVEEEGLNGSIQTTLDERGLMIRFTDTVLFDLGKADIKPEAIPILDVVAEEIASVSNAVRIEGHTDPTPINTAEFPSNWELSTARSTAIVHFMIESGGIPPDRLSAAGFAFYHPVAPNNTPENRTRNRRVDVIILKSEEERGEHMEEGVPVDDESVETDEPETIIEINPEDVPQPDTEDGSGPDNTSVQESAGSTEDSIG
jgi:chemotaxis protein MotB